MMHLLLPPRTEQSRAALPVYHHPRTTRREDLSFLVSQSMMEQTCPYLNLLCPVTPLPPRTKADSRTTGRVSPKAKLGSLLSALFACSATAAGPEDGGGHVTLPGGRCKYLFSPFLISFLRLGPDLFDFDFGLIYSISFLGRAIPFTCTAGRFNIRYCIVSFQKKKGIV